MRRSRLLLAVLLNLPGLAIVGLKFATMGSMADISGIAALGFFGASYLVFRHERRRASVKQPTSDSSV